MIQWNACVSSLARASERSWDRERGGQAFAPCEVTNESDGNVEQHLPEMVVNPV